MKMIKKLSLLMLLGALVAGCDDFLEPEPVNQQDRERIINDPSWAEGLLLEGYRTLPNGYSFIEVATDDAVTNQPGNDFLRMATGEWSALFNPVSRWGAYSTIFNLNYFLSVVDEVVWSWSSEQANELFAKRFRSEAHALRAYNYFVLLQSHGGEASNGEMLGIPLLTGVITVEDNWALPRNTFEECLQQINSDIELALLNLPEDWSDFADSDSARVFGPQNDNRINARTVKALKARVALMAASPAFNNGSYDQGRAVAAAEAAGDMIRDLGGVGALPTEGHLFYDDDNDIDNEEVIWRNDWSNSNGREEDNFPPSLFGRGRVNPTQNLVDAFPMANGYPLGHPSSGFDASEPFANRDPRLQQYILFNGSVARGDSIFTGVASELDGLGNTQESTRTGYYLRKLLRFDVNLTPDQQTEQRHFFAHFRYTEIFLNYAEAANEAWGPDDDPSGYGFTARQVIAAIRARAGIDPADPYLASVTTKEDMRQLIRNERRLELSFEGFRFWDLRRWDMGLNEPARGLRIEGEQMQVFEVEDRLYQPFNIYGPIPQNEIVKYDGLLQNQGYL